MDVWLRTKVIVMLFGGVINFGWINGCSGRQTQTANKAPSSTVVRLPSHFKHTYKKKTNPTMTRTLLPRQKPDAAVTLYCLSINYLYFSICGSAPPTSEKKNRKKPLSCHYLWRQQHIPWGNTQICSCSSPASLSYLHLCAIVHDTGARGVQ